MLAFLSRVALYEGTWQKFRGNEERGRELLDIAAKAAKQVIDSKAFSLFKPDALKEKAQKYMFILEDAKSNPAGIQKSANKEYVFARRYDESLAPIGKNITKANLINMVWVSRKFANMYLCQNGLPIYILCNVRRSGIFLRILQQQIGTPDMCIARTVITIGLLYRIRAVAETVTVVTACKKVGVIIRMQRFDRVIV